MSEELKKQINTESPASAEDVTEEEIKEELKTFIGEETAKKIDEQLDKMSDELVNKFLDGVAEQRAKIIAGQKIAKKGTESDQETVRKWFRALLAKDHNSLLEIQKGYMGTDDNAQGGYLVPPALLAEVNRFTEQYGIARREMRYLPFSGPGNSRDIPALLSSVSVFWVGEGGAKSSTKPTFKLVRQTLAKLAAIVPVTEELLEDSAIDIIRLLGELFAEAIAREEDRVFFAGATPADPFNGILNATGVIEVPAYIGDIDNLHADNLLDLIYAVPAEVRDKGKFYMHSSIFRIVQRLKGTDGHYIVQSPVGGQPATIWGRPFVLVDVMPAATSVAEGKPFIIYSDLSKTCVYGDKQGIRVKLLDQAIVPSADESPVDLNLATQDMVALRIVKRVGYVPILPAGIAVLTLEPESPESP